MMERSAGPAATRWEIVGAWLHVWTPPKDVDVPPVPVRKVVAGAIALALLVGLALALIIPPLDRAKRIGAADRAAAAAAADAAEAARLRADQRPHELRVAPGQSLVAALQAGITADARARVRRHTMSGKIVGTKCDPSPAYLSIYPQSRVYKCFAANDTSFQGNLKGDELRTGYAFVATIYSASRQVVWCKQNPHPDEKSGTRNANHIAPVARCAGKLRQVL
jgi:hypothetical protein